ncbi:hypothetical protein NMY22_g15113 [Coprinellus aureogranulatus]|nr:hypothetical protein NMY22_g15113 [Coprinellus aureogranulatus]
MLRKILLSAAIAAAGIPDAQALIRFACSQLVVERIDPLVTPGVVSPHLHQVIGGNAFNLTMDPKNDISKIATCTTCQFKENKSNYWTAVMFFKHPNGSYIRVPQVPNFGTGTPNGGMTVYYVQNAAKVTAPPVASITHFPSPLLAAHLSQGFRMITGNAMLRSAVPNATPRVTSFRCFGKNWEDSNTAQPPGGGTDTPTFPNRPCAGGIRSNANFPQCWDGVNVDSPDHASHVAHPIGPVDPFTGMNLYRGTCPESHPVRLPLIIFETIWDTTPFNDMWPTDGTQPFLYSMGDPTGYGHHGDYMFGWEGDALQRAMDTCTEFNGVPSYCKALTVQSDEEINKCKQEPCVEEPVDGYLRALPGCNPIQNGPEPATEATGCGAVSTTKGQAAAPTQV